MESNHYNGSRKIIENMRRNSPKIKIGGYEYNRQEVYENKELKRQLVEENPQLAEQLYYQWRDTGEKDIGKFFALRYSGHEEHGQSAFHIGNEIGILGMKRPSNPFIEQIQRLEKGLYI